MEECKLLLSGMDPSCVRVFMGVCVCMYVCVHTHRGPGLLTDPVSAGSMQQMQQMDEEKKGLWKTLMQRFSAKAPEEEKAPEK